MIEYVADVLITVAEMVWAVAEFPLRRDPREIVVGEIFRAKRASIVPAVIRPLTPEATRFEMTVPSGARLRVDLALPGAGNDVFLSFTESFDRELIPLEHRNRAMIAGVWLEIPPPLLKSHFERSRTLIRLTRRA